MGISTRLTDEKRNTIRIAIIGHRFDEERKQLRIEEHKVAQRVYRHILGEATLKQALLMPEDWLNTTYEFHIKLGGEKIALNLGKAFVCPYTWNSYGHVVKDHDLTHKTGLGAEVDTLDKKRRKYEQDRKAADEELKTILASFTTTGKLAEQWPDIKSFLAKVEDEPKPKQQLVALEALNAKFNLPPKTKKAA